ncbi:hypothetical protein CF319_g2885 [Tilletia indica]|nr:hypothetical protein CF319_g2885 [Tilletia indica]KAE8232064.1 hypothetical protein CF326_g2907 [Tilletia indica]
MTYGYITPSPLPTYGLPAPAPLPTDYNLNDQERSAFLTAAFDYSDGLRPLQHVNDTLNDFGLPPPSFELLKPHVNRLEAVKADGLSLDVWLKDLPPSLSQNATPDTRRLIQDRLSQSQSRAAAAEKQPSPDQRMRTSDDDFEDEDEYEDEDEDEEEDDVPPCAQKPRTNQEECEDDNAPPCAQKPRTNQDPDFSDDDDDHIDDGQVEDRTPPSGQRVVTTHDHSTASVQQHEWPLNPALRGGDGHFYRGPLSAGEVRALLQQDLTKQARRALTGSHTGYLQLFHFRGLFPTPPLQKRGSTSTEEPSDSISERWQCRVCHSHLHIPPGRVTNLGSHLHGTKGSKGSKQRTGCLKRNQGLTSERLALDEPVPRSASSSKPRRRRRKS